MQNTQGFPISIADMNRGRGQASAGHAGNSSVRKRKRLAAEKGRDPTPSEKHLRVHTHGHAGKSLVGEQSQSYMNDLMKYDSRKHSVILILMINVKHITKPLEGKR
ncbi:hypothetical protein MTR67_008005 [Solanum verrucosum]|uniref:Uncharacterized protein n=1 Tax=Solanum verrucosum TaxID=315347 RepID=A0AAF0TIT1_SOLVR|nr:hypothetical protein MTR67_008005 [Solanum verrucosum]